MISMSPDACIFTYAEKLEKHSVHSLEMSGFQPVIFNSHLFGVCYKNSCIFWLLPYLFWAVPLSYLRCHVLGLSPQHVHQTSSTVVLEKTLESPLDCKEIKPVNPKGNQHWIFMGRIDVEAEAPILWPPDAKSRLIGKDPDGGKDWRQEEKGMTEDEMVGWHHCLNGYEFEEALGDGIGQGSLACCSLWGHKESDMN